MVTQKRDRVLHVLMNGLLVGQLKKTKKNQLAFAYVQPWINMPGARPISLSLPLTDLEYSGDVVYNFIDNLLPDNHYVRWGIQTIFNTGSVHPFDLLAAVGRDCVGAVSFIEGDIPGHKKEINVEPLSEREIALALRECRTNPLGMSQVHSDFRISLAGAQAKTALLYYQGNWCRPLGETPTSHIFKFPMGLIGHENLDLSDSCEIEWLCSKITAAFGLPVATCEILMFEDIKTLSVQRFDRKMASDNTWLMRLPQEDMCQALGYSPNLKYQADGGPSIRDIMQLLLGSSNMMTDRDNFYRAQILFFLLAAIDGHAKNFSVFLEPQGRLSLTPLYDIISVHPLIESHALSPKRVKMAMALKGKSNHYEWNRIQRRHFVETVRPVNYPDDRAEQILNDMLASVDSVIEAVAAELPPNFPERIARSVFNGMKKSKRMLLKTDLR